MSNDASFYFSQSAHNNLIEKSDADDCASDKKLQRRLLTEEGDLAATESTDSYKNSFEQHEINDGRETHQHLNGCLPTAQVNYPIISGFQERDRQTMQQLSQSILMQGNELHDLAQSNLNDVIQSSQSFSSLLDSNALVAEQNNNTSYSNYQMQSYYQQLTSGSYPHQMPEPVMNQNSMADHHSIIEFDGNDVSKSSTLKSIEEAAASHLTTLRNNYRTGIKSMEGQPNSISSNSIIFLHGLQSVHQASVPLNYHGNSERQDSSVRGMSKRQAWQPSNQGATLAVDDLDRNLDLGRRRLCHFEGCFVTPTYNYPNEKKRIYCVTHKKEGMVNVVAKRCGFEGCAINPRFNFEGSNRGVYCSEHKLPGMVNVIDRRCQEPGCKKFPSHNYAGLHTKVYCASHKREGMVDMSHGPQLHS